MATGSLQELLEAARTAAPNDRINFRDRIAAHGAAAIAALEPWLGEKTLRAFAVRTVTKTGLSGHREAAVRALRAADVSMDRSFRDDVDEGLAALGARRPAAPTPTGPPPPTDEVNDDLYAYLLAAARSGRFVTYSDAAEMVGLTMRNPHHRRLIGQLLGRISTYEAEHGRPMLSSIVVNKDQRSKLGQGFYQLGEELRLKEIGQDPDAFARNQMRETFEHWGREIASPSGTTRTGAPDYRTRGPHEDPPPALASCEFTGASGQCMNPGRWDRDGHLSCTTHALAGAPQPWTRSG